MTSNQAQKVFAFERTAMLAGVRDISEVSVEPLPLMEAAEAGPFLPALPLLTPPILSLFLEMYLFLLLPS